MDDDRSSIPSVVDGLNRVQRTILLCALKNPNFQEVQEFIDYVSEHSADRKPVLVTTLTEMAQNYTGSNNINLLRAGSNYMCTGLSSITRHLFHQSDEPLLEYMIEDGKFCVPNWFMPIIPMILVNGGEGISTEYNPLDVIDNIKRLMRGKDLVPMVPSWYKWFRGTIQTARATYCATLQIMKAGKHAQPNRLLITALAIGEDAKEYEEFLKAAAHSGEDKEPFIKDYKAYPRPGSVVFEVIMSPDQMVKAQKEGLPNKFKITTNLDTNNMHLLDADGERQMYNPEEILKEFFRLRLDYYKKRQSGLLELVRKALRQLVSYVPIFDDFCEETIILNDKEDEVLYAELKNNHSLPSMEASTCSVEYKLQQRAEWFKKMRELDDILSDTYAVEDLWLRDLDALEVQLEKQEKEDDEEERRKKWTPVQDKDEVKMRKKTILEQDEEDEADMRKIRRNHLSLIDDGDDDEE